MLWIEKQSLTIFLEHSKGFRKHEHLMVSLPNLVELYYKKK